MSNRKLEKLQSFVRPDIYSQLEVKFWDFLQSRFTRMIEYKFGKQIVAMYFIVDNLDPYMTPEKEYVYYVSLFIGDQSKKELDNDGLSTGKIGVKGLYMAKQMVLKFIIDFMKKGQKIVCGAYDSKRRKVYENSLVPLGFRKTRYKNELCYIFTKDWE